MTSPFRSFMQAFRRRWRWPFKRGLRAPDCDPSCEQCKKWRGPGSFINEIWSKDLQASIEANKHLSEVIQHEPIMSKGAVIQIPSLTKKAKPVHKAPQFPCVGLSRTSRSIKTRPFKSSPIWAKVTCSNCLRSRLKKAYDKRRLGKFMEGLSTTTTKKETPITRGEFVSATEILRRTGGKINES